jgi:hypothetical protein
MADALVVAIDKIAEIVANVEIVAKEVNVKNHVILNQEAMRNLEKNLDSSK